MARRGENIYKRRDGRWEGRYKNGFKADGTAKYSSVYGKSYSAVKELLESKRAEAANNVCQSKCSVGEILKLWLSDTRSRVKESTYSNYVMKLNKHILPYFSGIRYDKLTVEILNSFITDKIRSGLAEKYVADIVILLKSAAKFAHKCYGYANRIEYAALPKRHKSAEKTMLSESELLRLKNELLKNPSNSNTGILLSALTGLRIGELCALKWGDIDFEKSIITVRRTVQRISNTYKTGTKLIISAPKSVSSVREIPIPDLMIPVLKEKAAGADAFVLSGNEKIVEPRTMQYRFKSLLKKLKLPYVNFHTLRHRFATNCVNFGIDIKTLSEILGHSSVKITLDLYVHSSIERKKACMKLFSDSISAA